MRERKSFFLQCARACRRNLHQPGRRISRPLRLGPMNASSHPARCFVFPVVFFSASNLGKFRQILGNGWIKFLLQQRKHQLTHAISREGVLRVAGVFPPRLPDILEVSLQLSAPCGQKRPHNLAASFAIIVLDRDSRMNSSQPLHAPCRESGAAERSPPDHRACVRSRFCGRASLQGRVKGWMRMRASAPAFPQRQAGDRRIHTATPAPRPPR